MTTSEHVLLQGRTLRVWFVSARERLARFPLSFIQLGMRIGVGMVFFNAGLLKYNSFEFAVKLFEDEYKVPLLDPAVAARLAMLPLLGMISVIQIFVYPQAWPDHVLWGSILLFLLTRGPGALSLDHLIERHFAR